MKSNLEFQAADCDCGKLVDKFNRHIRRLANGIKDKTELTEEERFAACVIAGVPLQVETTNGGNTLRFSTTRKAAVINVDGKWNVVME